MFKRWGIRDRMLLMALVPPTLIALILGFYVINLRIPFMSLDEALSQRLGKTRINRRRIDFDGIRRGLNLTANSDRFITAPMVVKKAPKKDDEAA